MVGCGGGRSVSRLFYFLYFPVNGRKQMDVFALREHELTPLTADDLQRVLDPPVLTVCNEPSLASLQPHDNVDAQGSDFLCFFSKSQLIKTPVIG